VNAQLAGDYAQLFARLDRLVLLKAPGFEVVHGWRLEQEAENAAATPGGAHVMDSAALERFIAHYERLTRHALRVLPSRADVVLELDAERRVRAAHYR
jgi:D-glycerate 3-kinase